MTDRATCLRRLSDVPDVAPVANSPTEVLSVLSGAPLSLALFGEPRARLDKSSSGALSRAGPRGSPTRRDPVFSLHGYYRFSAP